MFILFVLSLVFFDIFKRAKAAVSEGSLSASLFKRLDLFGNDDEKFTALHSGVADVVGLDDPTGCAFVWKKKRGSFHFCNKCQHESGK